MTSTTPVSTSADSSKNSIASSILTSLGGANTIDWSALAQNLSVAQFATQTDQLNAKSATLDKQITDAGNLKAALLNLDTTLGDRVRNGDLAPQPALSDPNIAQLSLSGSTPPKGTYGLEVDQLASPQALASNALPTPSTTVGSGLLTIHFGHVDGSTFTEDSAHQPVAITIPSGATLSDVASAINSSDAGISAYVANTSAGARLVMKGPEGQENGFTIDASENSADPGLSRLAWNPSTSDPTDLLSSAADAAYKLDGLPMTSASNSVSELVPGLNIKLTGTNAGSPATVSFSDNSSAITSAMQDFTSALNDLVGQVKTATDPQTGDLATDDGTRSLKQALSGLSGEVIMPDAPADAPRTLADLGLSIQRDGTFQLDGAKLTTALKANPTAVAAMFTNGVHGIYATIDNINNAADSSANVSSLESSVKRYTDLQTKAKSDLSDLATKQEALRQKMVDQFAHTQETVSGYTSTLDFLKNQIAAWNSKN